MLPPKAKTTISLSLLSCLILHSQIQVEESLNAPPIPFISCPLSPENWYSVCFAFYIIRESWYTAEKICQKWPSGHLTSIRNHDEANSVSSLLNSTGGSFQNVWIGLHNSLKGPDPNNWHWEWSNKDNLDYISWEWNPYMIADHGYCGCLTSSSGYMKWSDCHCETMLPFVCKYKY